MTFELHPNLKKKIFIADLSLCRLLLEDERHYVWVLLVPRIPDISRIMDLSTSDQIRLLHELDFVQRTLWKEFHPTQLNVAAIGNKTPQLHIHIITRTVSDPAWPNTVWDHPIRKPYEENVREKLLLQLRSLFSIYPNS